MKIVVFLSYRLKHLRVIVATKLTFFFEKSKPPMGGSNLHVAATFSKQNHIGALMPCLSPVSGESSFSTLK